MCDAGILDGDLAICQDSQYSENGEIVVAPLPLWLVPGIGPGDITRLQEFNLTRVGQVTALMLSHL